MIRNDHQRALEYSVETDFRSFSPTLGLSDIGVT